MTSPPPRTGLATDRYRASRLLGEGSQKRVYLAHDTRLDRNVAIAVVKTDGLDEAGLARVCREAQAIARLGEHAHIVTVYDVGEDAGETYIVCEYVAGGSVADLLKHTKGHCLAVPQAVRIAEEVCSALAHAHAQGLIHRDVKPSNVWLTRDGVAKLGDFGLAVVPDRSRHTVAGTLVGTVAYMAPEQMLGRSPDARSDLYSLGAMLYEMVTGRPPFVGDGPVAVITQHLNIPPAAPSAHNPAVPRGLDALILHLLAKAPTERPASAAATRAALGTVVSGGMVPAADGLPSGTVTLLMTDIERSTRRWQENEGAMRAALERHDGITREAVRAHRGHVVKHTGDGMVAVFARAPDAIVAAVQAQRALQAAEWELASLAVRMAVHSGDAHERDGDYFGPTINRAARLLAAAHGRQILVSNAAAALAADRLVDGIELVDVGEHRLRDLDRPERVSQACAPGLRRDFPHLRTAGELRRFPAMRTRMIGRDLLVARIGELLRNAPLVTLTGVGGSGKTRLAIETARQEVPCFADGAAFVDLSPLGESDLVVRTIANAVGALDFDASGSSEPRSATATLIAYLSERETLLVLDNCEHLIEACAEVIDRLLTGCPRVKVLATSREYLAIKGETVVSVPPLDLPGAQRTPADSPAVQLFVERADAVRGGLELLGRHQNAVVDICARLDGIPLAIELAAAQVAHFTPEEVADRLGDRFRFLTGGRRGARRQATLEAAVSWSYDLLGENERALLARLSVFAGDFSLDAVAGTCTGEGIEAASTTSLVASLVAKSMVVAVMHDRATRYRLLETIRAYAEQRLRERGEAAALRGRHRDWYLSWVESLDAERVGCPWLRPLADLTALESELDNLRVALGWCEREGALDLLGRIAVAADALWMSVGHYGEGLRWLAAARPALAEDPVLAARWAAVDGWVTMQSGSMLGILDKVRTALEAADRAGLLASQRPEAIGLLLLAGLSQAWGDPRVGRLQIDQALRIAERHGLAAAAVRGEAFAAQLWLMEGRFDEATSVLERIREAMHHTPPRIFDAPLLAELIVAHYLAGRHDRAAVVAGDVRAGHAGRRNMMHRMFLEAWAVVTRAGPSTYERALAELLDLFGRAQRDTMPLIAQYLLTLVAVVLTLRGDDEIAATVLAAARATGTLPFRSPGHYMVFRHYAHLLRQRLGHDVAARCREAGARMSLDAAAALARESLARKLAMSCEQ